MFETSIQGRLTEAAEPQFITALVECPAYEDFGNGANLDDTGITLWIDPAGTTPQEAAEGVIDLGVSAIIEECDPTLASNEDNPDADTSVIVGEDLLTCLSFIEFEVLTGTASADVLIGGERFDLISGRGGDDLLRGNSGSDQINGGAGADTILGGSGQDVIRGNSGDDVIRAGVGRDFVKGGGGADLINGGGGNDFLAGGAGDDTIIGRTGDDTLKGAAGADVFQFRTSDRNDTILDFAQGQDRIEILNGATSFADLSVQQDGADVLITFGSGQITVISDDADLFDASDFIF